MKNYLNIFAFIALSLLNITNTFAQKDTVSIENLDEYLSAKTGTANIVLTNWAVYYGSFMDESKYIVNNDLNDILNSHKVLVDLEFSYDSEVKWLVGRAISSHNLLSVKYPDNIENIGVDFDAVLETQKNAPFAKLYINNCPNLKKITLPKNLIYLGILKDCPKLESLDIPYGTKMVYAIENCQSIKKLLLPNSVDCYTQIENCPKIKRIQFPDSVRENNEFYPHLAIRGCNFLKKIKLPKNLTNDYAKKDWINTFYSWKDFGFVYNKIDDCPNLKMIEVSDGVKNFSTKLIKMESIKKVKLPQSLKYIDNHVFAGCTSLKKIKLPEGLKGIGQYAFEGCSNLRKINIPQGVTEILKGAFWACPKLKNGDDPNKTTICGRTFDYYDKDIVVDFENGEIPENAFKDFFSLKSVVITDKIKRINKDAFSQCIYLEKLELPNDIEVVAERYHEPFKDCHSLQTVVFPENAIGMENFGIGEQTQTLIIKGDYIAHNTDCIFGKTIEDEFTGFVYRNTRSFNPNMKIYVKAEYIEALKQEMEQIQYSPYVDEKLNYTFHPLEEL